MSQNDAESLKGGCLCGAVRYELRTEPQVMGICHCRDCQKATGSAYFPSIAVPAAALQVSGEPRTYATKADSGSTVTRAFCGTCGTTLWGWNTSVPEARSLSAATLDDPRRFVPMFHIYTASAQPWDLIPEGLAHFERMP